MKTVVPCKITYSAADGCWYVTSPFYGHGPMTFGDTLEDAKDMAAEAVNGLLESHLEHGDELRIPPMRKGEGWHGIPVDPGLAFAIWLRGRRKARKMTMQDAADRMGVKYQVYQKLENPRTANPTLKTLAKLEQVFDAELVAL